MLANTACALSQNEKFFWMQETFTINPLNNSNQHVQYTETHSGLENCPFCCSDYLCVNFFCFFVFKRKSLKYHPCPAQWGLCCLCNGIPSNKSMVFPYDRCDMANEKSGGRQRDEACVLSDVACAVIFHRSQCRGPSREPRGPVRDLPRKRMDEGEEMTEPNDRRSSEKTARVLLFLHSGVSKPLPSGTPSRP